MERGIRGGREGGTTKGPREGERSMRNDERGRERSVDEAVEEREKERGERRKRRRSAHIVTIIGLGWAHCLSFNFPAGFSPLTMGGTLYKSRELHGRTKLVNISVES